jgi:hypothetical protein
MIFDNAKGTDDAISKFDKEHQKILRELTFQIGFFKEKYINLKLNIYILNMILIALDSPKWKSNPEYLLPIIDSINISISLTIISIIQDGKRSDDLSVKSLIDLIMRNKKLFCDFLNVKYNYNMKYSECEKLLMNAIDEYRQVVSMENDFAKKYRDKKIAHFTKHSFSDKFMKLMVKEQKRIYIGLTKVFKSCVFIMVKYPIVSEPVISNSDKEIIRITKTLLKKLGVFKFIKKQSKKELLKELGFQNNRHYTVFYKDGVVIKS